MNNLRKVTLQEGVTLWYEDDFCVDIDVEPGVESVFLNDIEEDGPGEFCFDNEDKKSFPDVKELHIGKNVGYINLDNRMFPNVRHVKSDNPIYGNGSMLTGSHGMSLLNTFCLKEDEVIDLKGIVSLESHAFAGCESTKIINYEDTIMCSAKVFCDSAFEKMPYTNGIKVAGDMLIGIDKDCERVVIPDSDLRLCRDLPWKELKRLDVYDSMMLDFIEEHPKHIGIGFPVSREKLFELCVRGSQYMNILDSDDANKEFQSIDGIIYSADGKTLICCPLERTGKIVVPEGVEEISNDAFDECKISEIHFPSTLKKIGVNAVHGIRSLKKVVIPEGVVQIKRNAFFESGLETVVLPDSLLAVGRQAFGSCPIKCLDIPESLCEIERRAFDKVQEIRVKEYTTRILLSFILDFSVGYSRRAVKLTINGRSAIVPGVVDSELSISKIDDILKTYFSADVVTEDIVKEVYDLYIYCPTITLREDMAIKMYGFDRNNESAKEYIFRHSQMIADRLLKESFIKTPNNEEIMEFIKLGVMREQVKKQILDYSTRNGLIEMTASILELMKDKKDSEEFRV